MRKLAPEIQFDNPWAERHPLQLVHLLEHTSGFDDLHLREYAHNMPEPIDLEQALGFNPASRTSLLQAL